MGRLTSRLGSSMSELRRRSRRDGSEALIRGADQVRAAAWARPAGRDSQAPHRDGQLRASTARLAAGPGPLERSEGDAPAFRVAPVVRLLPCDLLRHDPPRAEAAAPLRHRAAQEPRAVRAGRARARKDGLWDWNIETERRLSSPRGGSRMLGYEDDEIEHHFREFENRLHPDDRDRVMEDDRRLSRGPAAELLGGVPDADQGRPLPLDPRPGGRATGLLGQAVPDGRLAYRHHRAEGDRDPARRPERAPGTWP